MNRTIYHELLALDLFYELLTWYERVLLHQLALDKCRNTTPNIEKWLQLIKGNNWKSPEKKVFADDDPNNTYYKIEKKKIIEWHLSENYKHNNPDFTFLINNLKNN